MAQATLSCCFAAIHLEAVKKTCRGHVFRPWESPRKSNDGSQRTGRRFPAIGTAPSDAIHQNRNWITLPRRGESRFARRTRQSHRRFVNRPYDATIRQSGKLEFGGESPLTNCSSCFNRRFLVREGAIWYIKYVGRAALPPPTRPDDRPAEIVRKRNR